VNTATHPADRANRARCPALGKRGMNPIAPLILLDRPLFDPFFKRMPWGLSTSILQTFALFALVLSVGSGCSSRVSYELRHVQWESVTVYYCVGSVSPVEQHSFTIRDRQTLDNIRRSLIIGHVGDLWGYAEITTNRLEVRLANGEQWHLHISSPNSMVARKHPHGQTSYRVVTDSSFYHTLMAALPNNRGIRFLYSYEVEIVPSPEGGSIGLGQESSRSDSE
jgi:hypothetical protein